MDFDGDGILDLISGSYDPGHCYLFRGKGKGEYKERETITDKSGKPVVTNTEMTTPVESFGSWVAMVDWDNDGDLDLILGTYQGAMLLRLNEGTRAKPVFAATNIPIQAAGKPLQVPGAHATPVVADWDGDGLWDLLSGSENGGVYFYRNIGKPGAPAFAAAVTLVPPHNGLGYNEFLDTGEKPRPGIRSQIFVADVDGDGKLDLLLGDFCTNTAPRPDLTSPERTKMLEIRRRMAELEPKVQQLREEIDQKFQAIVKEAAKSMPKADFMKQENQKKLMDKRKALFDEPGTAKLYKEQSDLAKELKGYLAKPAKQTFGADDMGMAHGYVWLYLRK